MQDNNFNNNQTSQQNDENKVTQRIEVINIKKDNPGESNATSSLFFGILAALFGFTGIIAFILGIVGLVQAKKQRNLDV